VVSNATQWVRERLATAPAIYGLVVYEVLIAANSDEPEDSALEVMGWAMIALVAFYLAHVFAEVVARHGAAPLGVAIRRGFVHSAGMLYAAVLPTIAMLVCAIAGLSGADASDWAMLVGLVVLAFLGYQATAERGRPVWARLLAAAATAVIGLLIMVIEYAVH